MSTTLAEREQTGVLQSIVENLEKVGFNVSTVDGRAELLNQAQYADVDAVLLCENDARRAESARVRLAPSTRLVVFSANSDILPPNPSTLVVCGMWLENLPEIAEFIKGPLS